MLACSSFQSCLDMSIISLSSKFPFDALDEIFGYACEGSSQRCLDLGLVCRFWYERFKLGEPLWSITLSQGRRRTPKSWNSYDMARKLASIILPLKTKSLHPIEDCTLAFRCPLVAENLQPVAPGMMFCDQCQKHVHLVRTQEEFNKRAMEGSCVMMRTEDIDPRARELPVLDIAVIYTDRITNAEANYFMATVAEAYTYQGDADDVSSGFIVHRSPTVVPQLMVQGLDSSGLLSCRMRFTLLTLEEARNHGDNSVSATMSDSQVFTFCIVLTAPPLRKATDKAMVITRPEKLDIDVAFVNEMNVYGNIPMEVHLPKYEALTSSSGREILTAEVRRGMTFIEEHFHSPPPPMMMGAPCLPEDYYPTPPPGDSPSLQLSAEDQEKLAELFGLKDSRQQ